MDELYELAKAEGELNLYGLSLIHILFKTARIGGTQGFLSYLGLEPPDWLAYGPIAITVSYTHLDVYKRQCDSILCRIITILTAF